MGKMMHRYAMVNAGDRIIVGLSGGKDSMTLLWFLRELQAKVPFRFRYTAVYLDPGFEGGFGEALTAHCKAEGFPFRMEMTDHGLRGHAGENRENPCFLCARLRRKRLFEIADELGCSKLALGHNQDDLIETLFLNICYAGEIATMLPSQPMFGGRFTVIRPLAGADGETIRRFVRQQGFPEYINPCPSAGTSKRAEIRSMLGQLYSRNAKVRGNIFRAIHHVRTDYLP